MTLDTFCTFWPVWEHPSHHVLAQTRVTWFELSSVALPRRHGCKKSTPRVDTKLCISFISCPEEVWHGITIFAAGPREGRVVSRVVFEASTSAWCDQATGANHVTTSSYHKSQVAGCYLETSLADCNNKDTGVSIATDRRKPVSRSQLAKVVTGFHSSHHIRPSKYHVPLSIWRSKERSWPSQRNVIYYMLEPWKCF